MIAVITALVFVAAFSALTALGILTVEEDSTPRWVPVLGSVASTSLVLAALLFMVLRTAG